MWSSSWGDTRTGRDWPDTLERPGVGRIDTFLIHRRPPDRLVESDSDVRIGLGPRSDVGDRDVQFEGSCGRPFAVGGDEFVSRVFDRGCDHERIRKPEFAVPSAKGCRGVSDPSIEIRNLDRQPFDEVVDHGDGTRSSTLRADETLGERGRGHGESITAAKTRASAAFADSWCASSASSSPMTTPASRWISPTRRGGCRRRVGRRPR